MRMMFVNTVYVALLISACGASSATPNCTQVCNRFGAVCGSELGCADFCASFSDQQKQCVVNASTCAAAGACFQTTSDGGLDGAGADSGAGNSGNLGDKCPCTASDVGDVCQKTGTNSGCQLNLTCLGSATTASCSRECNPQNNDCPNGFSCAVRIINTVNVGTWCSKT